MLPPLLDKTPSTADKWLWALLGALVVGQLVAIWMVCSQQVERAQLREAAAKTDKVVALRDANVRERP